MAFLLFRLLAEAGDPESGITDLMSNVNGPAVLVLATSGVIGMFWIIRWMVKYQKEFTNAYIDENNVLRGRLEALEAENDEKDGKISTLIREGLKLEQTISRHEMTIERQAGVIASHTATIERHEATIADLQRRLDPNSSTGG